MAAGDRSGPTLLNLALAEDRLGEDGRARMRDAEAAWPDWDEPPLRLAESYRRAEETVPAADAYERALAVNPNREEALLGLAVLRLRLGEPTGALPLLLRCCARAPVRAEAWDALGIAWRGAGDAAAAEAAAAEAQRLRPDDLGIVLRRVEAAIAAGGAEAELARLTGAASRDPLNVGAGDRARRAAARPRPRRGGGGGAGGRDHAGAGGARAGGCCWPRRCCRRRPPKPPCRPCAAPWHWRPTTWRCATTSPPR